MADVLAVTYNDRSYEVDLGSITPREFRAIKVHTGLKAGQFIRAFMSMDDFDADAAVALLWLCRTRSGERAGFDDDFPVMEVLGSITRVAAPAGDDEEGESPKAGSSTTEP